MVHAPTVDYRFRKNERAEVWAGAELKLHRSDPALAILEGEGWEPAFIRFFRSVPRTP